MERLQKWEVIVADRVRCCYAMECVEIEQASRFYSVECAALSRSLPFCSSCSAGALLTARYVACIHSFVGNSFFKSRD